MGVKMSTGDCVDHDWVYHGPEERPVEYEATCGCVSYSAFTAWNECTKCGATYSGTHYSSWLDESRCDGTCRSDAMVKA